MDASRRFLAKLKGVTDPERKRKIIGREFIEVFKDVDAQDRARPSFLAQGTLYPDVIESTSVRGPSAVIKSHHNVGGLPKGMKFKLVEPLRELFKDEVRAVGLRARASTRSSSTASRSRARAWPCAAWARSTAGRLDLLREADDIFVEGDQGGRALPHAVAVASPCCCPCARWA